MKAPLYFVLSIVLCGFLAYPATAQDTAEQDQDTTRAAQTEQEAVQAEQDAAETEQEAAQAEQEAAQIEQDAAQAEQDARQMEQDAAQAEQDARQAEQDVQQAEQDLEQMTQDADKATLEDAATSTPDTVTVAWVVSDGSDDAKVSLRGQLVEALGDEEYVFQDETGTIQVDIDDDVFGADPFEPGLLVEIYGEVDRDDDEEIEIDVERFSTL